MPLIPVDRFVLSRKPYAIDPKTYTIGSEYSRHDGSKFYGASVGALYVRRTRGVLGVHLGSIRGHVESRDADLQNFRDTVDTARYGASVKARWDGESLWTPEPVSETARAQLIAVLDPALEHVEDLMERKQPVTPPAGWDGWYSFVEPWDL